MNNVEFWSNWPPKRRLRVANGPILIVAKLVRRKREEIEQLPVSDLNEADSPETTKVPEFVSIELFEEIENVDRE